MAAAQPKAAPAPASAVVTTPAKSAVRSEASASLKVALPAAAVEPVRIMAARDGGCCPGPCKTSCCGPMACCATGILSGPFALSPSLFRTVTLIPRDVAGRSGPGPRPCPSPHEPSREVGRA